MTKTIEYFKQIHKSDSLESISMMKMDYGRFRILSNNLDDLKIEIQAETINWQGETFGQYIDIISKHYKEKYSIIYAIFRCYRDFEEDKDHINYDEFNFRFIEYLEKYRIILLKKEKSK